MIYISLVHLPEDQPSSYISGGQTREPGGGVPPLSRVRSSKEVGHQLSKGTAAALAAAQAEWEAGGGEPVRITDAYRTNREQAFGRERYERWIAAGRPRPWSVGFDRLTMKADYVARPGQSHHGWGGAIDIDVGALYVSRGERQIARGTDAALAAWWKVAERHGFDPIISEPDIDQSESWHFDHLGEGLGLAYNVFKEYDHFHPNTMTALAATALAGQGAVVFPDPYVAYAQAACALLGEWPGPIDGILGEKTKRALKLVGVSTTAKPVAMCAEFAEDAAFVELVEGL